MPVSHLISDPNRILRSRGLEPDPWQQELLSSSDARILLNCSRQVGKTTVVGALALHQALHCPGRPVVVIAPSLRQSLELYQQVYQGWEAIDRPIGLKSKGLGKFELKNGSRVLALPASEATIRGIGGVSLLVIDEASRVADDLYKSVRPMLAASAGRLIALSTPYGKRGWFYSEWISTEPWRRFQIPWQQCPRIKPDFIEAERRSLGDSWVEQEYGCAFVSGSGLVYPDFARTLSGGPPPLTGKLVGGIDFGWRNPFAAVWGQFCHDGILWITGERVQSQAPLSEHLRALPRGVIWWADPAGRTETEELRAAGLNIRPGSNSLEAGIAAVTARIRMGHLRVDTTACPLLVREAELYRWPDETANISTQRISPVNADNHALAALRYLIMGIDRGRTGSGIPRTRTEKIPQAVSPRLWNEHFWTIQTHGGF